ncbi:hypothetical protein EO98_06335 [Methanosarcina sp. 2.H.T.1A.6]|uniref:DUF1616 domain-containing protein n=1 Tax=unclassified Methanosarcina TaxID=2644672 RepID=UPI0006219363|nr:MULTISPECIES: DUF1616 domain-containing protein [unclassified Methanosarcina]KKG14547.1 hypothetical protein EO94_14555 [Methanosarcina sp. 2.H.T.1A.3]KKG24201.1 hypothetical protein EO96_00690 [Methanosarcina sp. 2.H.T.1A.8]KKG24986.1 hypothetical protein EO98_06335 [Methanosarcina sp. 2.H.T.1A.6]KKG27607.1 hypothetical protein EO97_06035 [Methanosarcina sp. 2.H.T.1A.15]
MAGNRQSPLDLLLVAGLVILTDIFILVPALSGSFLRTIFGLLLVLFLPGYALIGALLPAKKDIDGIERALLSLGLSIAVVPLMGLGMNYTDWGIREVPVLTGLSIFTIFMCGAAYYRRRQLPEAEAFEVPVKASISALKTDLLGETRGENRSGADRAISMLLVISILASLGSLAYVIGNPREGEAFTEFYILGPDRIAENYPTNYTLGDSGTVVVGITNHEYRTVDYTMEIRLENRSLPLPENQKYVNLDRDVSWKEPVTFTPPFEGKNMKLEFLLFNETEKSVPYRNVHLWINVTKEV